jgi:sterol desaturase/sphingolipid hydroxylase (fatty acid hydroxylase superfamily)
MEFAGAAHYSLTRLNEGLSRREPFAQKKNSLSEHLSSLSGGVGTVVTFLLVLLFFILPIFLIILAVQLAYTCNEGDTASQVISVIIALLFPLLYLLFYFIYHFLLGAPCGY